MPRSGNNAPKSALTGRPLVLLWLMLVGIAGPLSATSQRPKLSLGTQPIELVFSQPASVVEVYRAWGKFTDIEILTDPELQEQAETVSIQGKTARIGLDGLAQLYDHFHLVLDEHTLVVIDDTPEKRLEYQAFEVESFFVKHAASPAMLEMVKRMIGVRHATTDAELGRVTLMDTPRRLEIAGDILRMADTLVPEVMIEVELLAIQRSDDASTLPLSLSADERREFERTVSAKTVAKSRVNAFGGASTRLDAGDMPPASERGFDLDLNARPHAPLPPLQGDDASEVTLALKLHTSGVLGTVTVDGHEQPVVASGQFATTIRLRDGETYLLSGLAPDDELVVALTPDLARVSTGSGVPTNRWLERGDRVEPGTGLNQPAARTPGDRERVRERLRERLRSMPRGLQDSAPNEQQPPDGR